MNIPRLTADLAGGVWAMRENEFLAMSAPRADGMDDELKKLIPPICEIEGGILVANISGALYRGIGPIGRLFGFIDPEDIADELDDKEPDADAVLLVIDSPGGSVSGIADLAAKVRAIDARKPVFVYTPGLCCSAAYWIASQASAIYASMSAFTGSIGVFQAFLDQSRRFDAAGVKVELFKSGPLKAAGMTGTSLSDEQKAAMQATVDTIFAEFSGAVLSRRRVKPEAMTGGDYYGKTAKPLGLVDSISDLTTAKSDLRKFADLKRMKG